MEQQDLIRKIYPYCWETPDQGTLGSTDVSVFCEKESEFREIEVKGWQYDLDIMYSDAMVQIAGLGFAAKITWMPRLQGFLWTLSKGREPFTGCLKTFSGS